MLFLLFFIGASSASGAHWDYNLRVNLFTTTTTTTISIITTIIIIIVIIKSSHRHHFLIMSCWVGCLKRFFGRTDWYLANQSQNTFPMKLHTMALTTWWRSASQVGQSQNTSIFQTKNLKRTPIHMMVLSTWWRSASQAGMSHDLVLLSKIFLSACDLNYFGKLFVNIWILVSCAWLYQLLSFQSKSFRIKRSSYWMYSQIDCKGLSNSEKKD